MRPPGHAAEFSLDINGESRGLGETVSQANVTDGDFFLIISPRTLRVLGHALDRQSALAFAYWILNALEVTERETQLHARGGRNGRSLTVDARPL